MGSLLCSFFNFKMLPYFRLEGKWWLKMVSWERVFKKERKKKNREIYRGTECIHENSPAKYKA